MSERDFEIFPSAAPIPKQFLPRAHNDTHLLTHLPNRIAASSWSAASRWASRRRRAGCPEVSFFRERKKFFKMAIGAAAARRSLARSLCSALFFFFFSTLKRGTLSLSHSTLRLFPPPKQNAQASTKSPPRSPSSSSPTPSARRCS